MNEFKEKIKRWRDNVVSSIKNAPEKIKESSIDFGSNVANSVVSMPKYSKYVAKSWYAKLVNFPNSTVAWGKKVAGYRWKDYKKILLNNAILFTLLILIIYIIIENPNFFSLKIATTILNQASTKLIIALGCGTIIVARGTDLSAGRTVGLTAFVAAIFSQNIAYKDVFVRNLLGNNAIVIVIVSMLVGALVGILNGIIVAKLNVTPFVATLGTMLVIYGLNMFVTDKISGGQPIGVFADEYTNLSSGGIHIGTARISWLAVISLFFAFFMWIVWTKLPFGRKLFAVGGNPRAAAVSGISVVSILLITYMIGGALYGIAGAFETWRVGSVTVNTGYMYELDAIAAAIVGGLSFDGGRGKISGIIIGVLMFQTITFGFAFLGVGSAITYIIKGAIIIGAVAFDALKNRVKK